MSLPPERLTEPEIHAALADLPGWSLQDGKLQRRFEFSDFVEAFGFMSAAALCAERTNHHPDWRNAYRKVWVELVTHERNGVTALDLSLAAEMSRLALGRAT